jgi:hypothetical protein
VQQPHGALQHPGAGQLEFGRPLVVVGEVAQDRLEAGGDGPARLLTRLRIRFAAQEAEVRQFAQDGADRREGGACQRGGGVRVDLAGRGEGEQAQGAGGGRGQRVVAQPGHPGQFAGAARAVGGRLLQPVGEVGHRGLGVGREVPPGQHQGGGLRPAPLDEAVGGARVDGEPDLARPALQQGVGVGDVEAAEGAGADPGEPGERPPGDGDEEQVGGALALGHEGVDLFRGGGVVEQDQQAAAGEFLAQGVGEVVVARAGDGAGTEAVEQQPGGLALGQGGPVDGGETGAQDAVRVAVGERGGEVPGQRGAAGAGGARDEQEPGARGAPSGDGVEAGPVDLGAQLLQLSATAEEGWAGRAGRRARARRLGAAGADDLIRHGPHSRSLRTRALPGT